MEDPFYGFMLTSILEVDQGCDEFQKAERVSIICSIKMWIYTQQEMQEWNSPWDWGAWGIHKRKCTLLLTF